MRAALHALTDELKRLKTSGVKSVSVSDESVATLRRVIAARSAGVPKVEAAKPLTVAAVMKPYEPPAPAVRAIAAAKPAASGPALPPPPG